MRGSLDFPGNGVGATSTVSVASISFDTSYDVIVYFDGDNGTNWRVANYRLADNNGFDQTVFGEDSEGVAFNNGNLAGGNENADGYFQHPVSGGAGNQVWPVTGGHNTEGNYFVFSGLTGFSFTLESWGSTNSGSLRAPINGIQILGAVVPEPASLSLLLLGGVALLRRRMA